VQEALQGFASNPIPISGQEWDWPNLSQSAEPGVAEGGSLFMEPGHFPELEASPADTLASLQSASQRQNSLEASLARRNSTSFFTRTPFCRNLSATLCMSRICHTLANYNFIAGHWLQASGEN